MTWFILLMIDTEFFKEDSDCPQMTTIGGSEFFNLVIPLSTCFLNFALMILSFVTPEITIAILKIMVRPTLRAYFIITAASTV